MFYRILVLIQLSRRGRCRSSGFFLGACGVSSGLLQGIIVAKDFLKVAEGVLYRAEDYVVHGCSFQVTDNIENFPVLIEEVARVDSELGSELYEKF